MNKKGFTLIELLAVLILLAIVMGITIASVSGIFKSTKEKSEDAFVGTIKDAMEMYLTSEDAKSLSFGTTCTNQLSKSHGNRKVYKTSISFSSVINSEYKPITQDDLVNPANEEVSCGNPALISVNIYRDEDFVYYYSIDKDQFVASAGGISCLLNDETKIKEYDQDGNPIYYSSVITNLPEGFSC